MIIIDEVLLAAQTREAVLNWITNNEYQTPHNFALQGLLEDTGNGFLIEWSIGNGGVQVLLVYFGCMGYVSSRWRNSFH